MLSLDGTTIKLDHLLQLYKQENQEYEIWPSFYCVTFHNVREMCSPQFYYYYFYLRFIFKDKDGVSPCSELANVSLHGRAEWVPNLAQAIKYLWTKYNIARILDWFGGTLSPFKTSICFPVQGQVPFWRFPTKVSCGGYQLANAYNATCPNCFASVLLICSWYLIF